MYSQFSFHFLILPSYFWIICNLFNLANVYLLTYNLHPTYILNHSSQSGKINQIPKYFLYFSKVMQVDNFKFHRIVVMGTYDKYMFNIGNQIVVRQVFYISCTILLFNYGGRQVSIVCEMHSKERIQVTGEVVLFVIKQYNAMNSRVYNIPYNKHYQ